MEREWSEVRNKDTKAWLKLIVKPLPISLSVRHSLPLPSLLSWVAAHSGVIQTDSLSEKALQRSPHALQRINTSQPFSQTFTWCLVFFFRPQCAHNSCVDILMGARKMGHQKLMLKINFGVNRLRLAASNMLLEDRRIKELTKSEFKAGMESWLKAVFGFMVGEYLN